MQAFGLVTPLAGVWVEILMSMGSNWNILSLPSRECGLKFLRQPYQGFSEIVTPLAGVWVEIFLRLDSHLPDFVTPLAGVWVEMDWIKVCICGAVVTPLAGVWVEILCRKSGNIACPVTPLAGVWVEIGYPGAGYPEKSSHSPRGSVG